MIVVAMLCIFLAPFCIKAEIESSQQNIDQETEQLEKLGILETPDEQVETNQTKVFCGDSIQIQQSSGNETIVPFVIIPPAIITDPGIYCVVENITIPRFQNGITIESDNVLIDLNDHCIQGETNSFTAFIIASNVRNVTIRNGSIKNMGKNGISVNAGTSLITLDNLKIFNNRNNGISITNAQTCVIKNCITSFNTFDGISFSQTSNANNQNLNNQNWVMKNCLSTFNRQHGFEMVGCTNFHIINSFASNNRINGFRQENGSRLRFDACQAHNNRAVGFFSSGDNQSLNECLADNNTTIGFRISGNQQNLEKCQAKVNTTGFEINGSNHAMFNCSAQNNSSTGILLLAGSTQCQIRDNTTIANGTGLQDNTTTINRIYSNFSSDNTTANFVGVPAANIATSPAAATAINFTANIAN